MLSIGLVDAVDHVDSVSFGCPTRPLKTVGLPLKTQKAPSIDEAFLWVHRTGVGEKLVIALVEGEVAFL